MSRPLPAPTVVVGVGDSVRSPELRDALLEGRATEIRSLEPAAAVDAARDPEVGCLLADRLPETTGTDLCREVRARDAAFPVVFYADDSEGVPRKLLNAGADGYYTPADPLETVRHAVDDCLETYGRRLEARVERAALTALLEGPEPNVYVKDGKGRYLHATPTPRIVDPEDAIGRTDLDLYGETNPEMARRTTADDRRVVETGASIRGQDERYDHDSTAHTVRTTKIPWSDGGREGLVGVSVDVTDLKRSERELEELRERFETFARNVRHDLRNPLQVAAGHLELAEETGDEDHLDRVRAALSRIDEMIEDLETVANGSTGGSDGGAGSLADVVEDVWSVYPGEATLENRLPAATNTPVDEETIRPALENLFTNAVEHGSTSHRSQIRDDAVEHGPTSNRSQARDDAVANSGEDVTVRIGALDDGFYVEDTGRGIPESERETVLEPGYTTDPEGTGVGLGLVSDICDAQGWKMAVGESAEGGARFSFRNCPLVSAPTADERTDVGRGDRLDLESDVEIGDLEAGGTVAFDPGANRWTVAADGDDVRDDLNDLQFVYATADGDVTVRARLVALEGVDPCSKAGVMIRSGRDGASTYGYVGDTPEFGTELLWRTRPGEAGVSHQLEGIGAEWLRADLLGERLTCFVSPGGDRWTPVDQRPIERTGPVHAGIVVCSAVPGRRCEAVFEDATVASLDRASGD
ncbi:ATP-binding protein [Saliphagus infecundisoli]|uniref:histidine kinase n=1 Tax=Saliphagus infecundisoli TaxID=1849069 RepID=A0ABD5QF61_9EURY|nr:ATP-binding protein [Saliphagus infecundisoli]